MNTSLSPLENLDKAQELMREQIKAHGVDSVYTDEMAYRLRKELGLKLGLASFLTMQFYLLNRSR